MSEDLKELHGFDVPAKGEKVTFLNLNKQCTATGDGVHTCYELIGHHQCTCCEPKTKTKKKSSKKKDD